MTSDGKQGLRDIALAYRELPSNYSITIQDYEQHLTFLGFATLGGPAAANHQTDHRTGRKPGSRHQNLERG